MTNAPTPTAKQTYNGGRGTPTTTVKPTYSGGMVAPTGTVRPTYGAGGSSGSSPDLAASLTGAKRDAFAALENLFNGYGLGSLTNDIYNYVVQGYSADTISIMLQQTDAWKQRFAGNEIRRKAGLPVLDPATYLSLESSYRQILSSAGMPKGFYDSPSDFAGWIGNDVSASEINTRVQDAVKAAQNTDPGYRHMLAQYGIDSGGIAAYFLDTKRALPILDQTFQSINIANAARMQGLHETRARADQLASLGVTGDQALGAYSQIADMTAGYGRAGTALGVGYNQTDAENEQLLGLASARRKRTQIEDTFKALTATNQQQATKGAYGSSDSSSY